MFDAIEGGGWIILEVLGLLAILTAWNVRTRSSSWVFLGGSVVVGAVFGILIFVQRY
jgi:hypothetical protein